MTFAVCPMHNIEMRTISHGVRGDSLTRQDEYRCEKEGCNFGLRVLRFGDEIIDRVWVDLPSGRTFDGKSYLAAMSSPLVVGRATP